MKLKRWLSLPIIAGGLLAFIPYSYFNAHHKNQAPTPPKSYTMSYGKYLEDMRSHNSLVNTEPTQLTGAHTDPPLLGYGYDLSNGTFSKKNAFDNVDDIGIKIVPIESSYSFESITSANQLNTDLGVNGSMKFGFKHFALSGAAKFHKTALDTSSDIHISFRMKTDVVEIFDYNNKAQLSPKAKALVENKDTTTFFNEYDAKYTTKLYATREVLFNLNIKLDSKVDSTKVKAKINFKKGLLSLSGALHYAKTDSKNSTEITMSTLSLPGNKIIYPSNTKYSINDDDDDNRTVFLRDMQKVAYDYMNIDDKDRGNPSKYFAKGISEDQLDSYSYYNDKAATVINPNIAMLKAFPELNQYYDLYQNMAQDLTKLNSMPQFSYDPLSNKSLILNQLNNYVSELNYSFSNSNQNFVNLFKNHDLTDFENECQNYDKLIFSSGSDFSSILKLVDGALHIEYLNLKSINSPNDPTPDNDSIIVTKNLINTWKWNLQMYHTAKNCHINIVCYSSNGNDFLLDKLIDKTVFSKKFIFNSIRTLGCTTSDGVEVDTHESLSLSDFTQINSKRLVLENHKISCYSYERQTRNGVEFDRNMEMSIGFDSAINIDVIYQHPIYTT